MKSLLSYSPQYLRFNFTFYLCCKIPHFMPYKLLLPLFCEQIYLMLLLLISLRNSKLVYEDDDIEKWTPFVTSFYITTNIDDTA